MFNMKLEKFKEKNKRKKSIIVFTICCVLLIVSVFFYQTFALFETKDNFNFIEGNINNPGDLYFAYYIDDQITLDIPNKNSGYTLSSKSNCNNKVIISWDNESWSAILDYNNYQKENNSRVKCNLYFEKTIISQNIDYLKSHAADGQILEADETIDHNLRYIGANPNNYVLFNNELWQIIGVMNNVSDEKGVKESRIKLIRSESIGSYSWDSSESSINTGKGINEWSEADLMKLLNPGYESESVGGSLYWNRDSGTCYNALNNTTTDCDFRESGLLEESKDMIETIMWNTGSDAEVLSKFEILTSQYYEAERSNNTEYKCAFGDYCNDNINRNSIWTGKVGLMYPSDFGYATSGGKTTRTTCLNTCIYDWEEKKDCQENDWLLKDQYLMMPVFNPKNAFMVNCLYNQGLIVYTFAGADNNILPVVYLKNNVKIYSGNGSNTEPFLIHQM